MNYDVKPIENFSPLRHSALVAEALGEVVPDLLASLTQLTNPYRVDTALAGTVETFEVVVNLENLTTGISQDHTVTFTSDGTETFDQLLSSIVTEFNTLDTGLHSSVNLNYSEDEEKYITVVPKEGYRMTSAPTPSNLILDLDVQVQGKNGKPAAYGAGQKVLEQGYPKLIVTSLPITSISETWSTGGVEKDLNDGNGLQFFPYYDSYLQVSYQVTVEAGKISDILTSSRPDSSMILRKFVNRMRESNTRVGFYNKVSGTLSRDFTVVPVPAINYAEYEDSSVMTFTLDIIQREVNYDAGIITAVGVAGGKVTDQKDSVPQPVDFEVEAPSHPTP